MAAIDKVLHTNSQTDTHKKTWLKNCDLRSRKWSQLILQSTDYIVQFTMHPASATGLEHCSNKVYFLQSKWQQTYWSFYILVWQLMTLFASPFALSMVNITEDSPWFQSYVTLHFPSDVNMLLWIVTRSASTSQSVVVLGTLTLSSIDYTPSNTQIPSWTQ